MRYVVIMAGGAGTRLWPLSRRGMPKQLLPIFQGRSLLRIAFERATAVVPPDRVLVVTGAGYLDEVAAALPEVPPENLLGEPIGRDSLNACAWPAAVLLRRDPDAVIAQLTADHIIEPVTGFAAALDDAFEVAETQRDVLVTLGVVPTSPHTGYGYLQRGESFGRACRVLSFKEKPDADVAATYLASGDYWWNSGMFVWRADTLLAQIRQLQPSVHDGVTELAAHPDQLGRIFPALTKISVDYAVLEPVAAGLGSAAVVAVPLAVDWKDVGGYQSLAEVLPRDAAGNATTAHLVALDAANNIVVDQREPGRLIALLGVSDLIVVETEDATLVAAASSAEQVKQLVGRLAEESPEYA